MTSRRMIDPAIWQSETIASLSRCQRLLFIGLFSNADDQGRLRGNPSLIRSTIFPYDDIPLDEIRDDLAAIERVGSIIIYEAEGKELIQISGWWEYQTPQWAYPSKYPTPPSWCDRLRYRENNLVVTRNWNGKGGNGTHHAGEIPKPPQPPAPTSHHPLPETDYETEALPKALPKALPEPIGGPIEIRLELGLESGLEIKEGESLKAAGTREKPPPPPSVIPAFKIWTETGLSPGIHNLDIAKLDEVVGRSPPSLELFTKICESWRSLGWKRTNVAGILEYFCRGEIPGQKGHTNGHKPRDHHRDGEQQSPPGIEPDTWANILAELGTG